MPQPNQAASTCTPTSGASAPQSTSQSKAALRAAFRRARRDLAPEERDRLSSRIASHILAWLYHLNPSPRTVALYLAGPHEANLDALIEPLQARGIRAVAPRSQGFALIEAASTCSARPSESWRQAAGAEVQIEEIDVVLLPGLAFGRDGSRLGQGGGWFDRALQNSRAILVGVGFGCQITDALPVEAHDVAVSWIADEDGVRRAGSGG